MQFHSLPGEVAAAVCLADQEWAEAAAWETEAWAAVGWEAGGWALACAVEELMVRAPTVQCMNQTKSGSGLNFQFSDAGSALAPVLANSRRPTIFKKGP